MPDATLPKPPAAQASLFSSALITGTLAVFLFSRLAFPLFNRGSYIDEYLHIYSALSDFQASVRGLYVAYAAWAIMKVFGYSLFALKLFPAVCGMVSGLVLWRIATRLLATSGSTFLFLAMYLMSPWVLFNHFYIRMYVVLELVVVLTIWLSFLFYEHASLGRRVLVAAVQLGLVGMYLFWTHDVSQYVPVLVATIAFGVPAIGRWYTPRWSGGHRTVIVALLAMAATASLVSHQDAVAHVLDASLVFSDAAHKFDRYFLALNLLITVFFFLGAWRALGNSSIQAMTFALTALALFAVHAFAGYSLQMMRALFYFNGIFYLLAVYGLESLGVHRYQRLAIGLGFIATVGLNYPRHFWATPSIPREIEYRSYAKMFDWTSANHIQAVYGAMCLGETFGTFFGQQWATPPLAVQADTPQTASAFVDRFMTEQSNAALLTDGEGYSLLARAGQIERLEAGSTVIHLPERNYIFHRAARSSP